MFGMPAVKHRTDRAFAGLFDGTMVFKLDGPEHAEALGLAGASLIRSLGHGAPVRAVGAGAAGTPARVAAVCRGRAADDGVGQAPVRTPR